MFLLYAGVKKIKKYGSMFNAAGSKLLVHKT
jgi:hypothetical protein